MTKLTRKRVTQVVTATRDRYLSMPLARLGVPMRLFEVNNGMCDEFADDVAEELGFDQCIPGESDVLMVVQGENFQRHDETGATLSAWDEELLRRHWGISAPVGTTWKEVNAIDFGTHLWVAAKVGPGGTWLHFDAECVEGVASFFELPLFRRYLQGVWPTVEDVQSAPVDCIF